MEAEFGTADVAAILARYPVADFPSPKHALAQMAGDVEAVCEARRVARLIESRGTPVYLYSFDTEFVFGNNFGPPSTYVLNEADRALFNVISGYWTRFAAEGNWPIREDKRWREAHCDFWEPFFLGSVAGSVPASQR